MKVKELIEKLSKFNPEATLISECIYDELKPEFSWTCPYDVSEEHRDIEKEMKEAEHVTLELVKSNEEYRNGENF